MTPRARWTAALAVAATVAVLGAVLADRRARREEPPTTAPRAAADDAPGLIGRAPGSLPAASDVRRAGEPSGAPAETKPVTVVGRVVSDRRRPIEGATVVLRADPLPVASVRTAADGRFRFDGAAPDRTVVRGSVLVSTEDGRGALALVVGWPGRPIDVGTLEVDPVHVLPIRVTDGGTPVLGALWRAWTFRRGNNFVLVDEGTTDASGHARTRPLPTGFVHVFANGPEGRRALAQGTLPRTDPTPLEIALVPERTVAVRVVESGPDRRPVPRATLTLQAAREQTAGGTVGVVPYDVAVPATDDEGRTTIRGLYDGEEVVVHLRAAGFEAARERVEPAETSVRVVLPRARRVEWPLVAGERPVPADGTVVDLVEWPTSVGVPHPPHGRVQQGRLVVEGLPNQGVVHALAVAPDGSLAELHKRWDAEAGAETSFRRPRRLHARVTDETGLPVPGVLLLPSINGNDWFPAYLTNADGRASIQRLPARAVDVRAFVTDQWHSGTFAARADLSADDGDVEIHVGAVRDVTVRVFVDGSPGLPPGLEVGLADVVRLDEVEDADAGVVRLRVRPYDPAQKGSFRVGGDGFLPFEGEFDWPPPGTPLALRADLASAGRLELDVRAPAGAPLDLILESPDDAGRWLTSGFVEGSDEPGVHVVEGLAPGSYRARDQTSGVSSAPVVLSGSGVARAVLDLSTSFVVSGRVELPDGYDLERVRIVPEGPGLDVSVETARNGEEGWELPGSSVDAEERTFRVVAARSGVTLAARHPELRGETAVVTGPRDDLVLRLAEGRRAVLRLSAPGPLWTGGLTPPRVRLYSGEPSARAEGEHVLAPAGEGWRFAGFRPGTYTVWIDASPFAPKVLRGVVLGDGLTDLGGISLESGSTVEVRVRAAPGKQVPKVRGEARSEGDPRYVRDVQQDGERVRIRGLGPGRFKARFQWVQDHEPDGFDGTYETFESDGRSDVVLDLDVR